MNPRNTITVVAAFLLMFWIFGLFISLGKTRVDDTVLFPSLKSSTDYEIDSVLVERSKGKEEEYRLTRDGEQWSLAQGKQSIKVDAFRVRDLIREVRDAKRDEETAVTNNPAEFGLKAPHATITLTGHPRKKDDKKEAGEKKVDAGREKQWKLFLGNDSPDKKFVYVASSDRPGRVFAVSRVSLNSAFFKNANDLRSKRLFDFSEPTVQSFSLKEGSGEFEAKRMPGGTWLIVKPNLGYADFEGPPPPKDAPPGAPPPEGGLKALLAAVAAVRVDSEDDFVPPASDTVQRNDLVAGKEKLRIQVFSGDEKKPTEETLLVGREEKDYFYARLSTDEGTFKIQKKLIAPLLEAIKAPEKLRSRDLAPIPIKEADAITLTQGKEEARFLMAGDVDSFHGERDPFTDPKQKVWQIELDGKRSPANKKAIESLLEALQGRRDVVAFKDITEAEAAKVDAELGLDSPQTSAAIYLGGLETGKDAIGKDAIGKDAKKDEPKLKKDAKPAVSWQFGKIDNDQVWVKRTMPDGPTARFAIKKSAFEKVLPREGLLGYLEPNLPKINPGDVIGIQIDRAGKTVALEKRADRWMLKDPAGDTPADAKKAEDIARVFSSLEVRRWVKKLDPKDDLEALGLKSPNVTLTLTTKMDKLSAQAIGSTFGQLGGLMNDPALAALGAAWANLQLGGEKIVVKFGKEATEKDDAGGLFVQHSKSDRLGLTSTGNANLLRDADFRDRSTIFQPQLQLAALAMGAPGLFDASPLVTGHLGRADAKQVKDLNIVLRTPFELRTFSFVRKDKGWVDQSGLKEFQVDEEAVNTVAELVARLNFNRVVLLSGGPKADQKLTPNDATLVIRAIMADLRIVTVVVGANFEGAGYFMQSSTWPGAVFLVNPERVQPILNGARFFAKERVAAN
jgi:hypothetical protein